MPAASSWEAMAIEKVRLFIGNLAPPITDVALTSMLSKFGEWFGAMLRVEVATEHYESRLKRERAAEHEPVSVPKPSSSSANELAPVATFSWKGKRTVFSNEHTSSKHRESKIRDNTINRIGNGVTTSTKKSMPIRTLPKASARVEATLDLFGLGEEEPELPIDAPQIEPKPDEGRAAKRARETIAEIAKKDAEDEAAMAAIGDDPSRIDVAAERDRALAIMSQLLAGNGGREKSVSDSAAESVAQCRRKALYVELMDQKSVVEAEAVALWAPGIGLEGSDENSSMSEVRRKGLYRLLVSS
eukprot:IDg10080t1